MKNLIWWVALGVFAVAALVSGLQGSRQSTPGPQGTEHVESLGDYVIRTCANGQAIVKAVHDAALARGTRSATQYALSQGAAHQFLICVQATPDPLTRDWATFNYAFWLSRSAPPTAAGIPILESSSKVLAQLSAETPYPVVKNGANDLHRGTDAQLAELRKTLAKRNDLKR